MNNEYLFVGEDLKLHTGEEAKERLEGMNDEKFFDGAKGVVCVPKDRWHLAQSYEKRTWMDACSHATDDRNEEHAKEFDNFRALFGPSYSRAIELGCGPFTNLRVIARYVDVGRCVLLDPLIESYKTHRNCAYLHGKVVVAESRFSQALGKNKAGRALRRLVRMAHPSCLEEGLVIEKTLPSPIEEMPDCGKFDLVVMINVIEHCYDIHAIFDKILYLCRAGTRFVFHDRLFRPDEVQQEVKSRFDAGHPLRVGQNIIREFLEQNFVTLFEHVTDIPDRVGDIDLTEKGIYFIGERV